MATENILMAAVKAGGNRQELHERIRVHSQAAAEQVKKLGNPNDLLERLKNDPAFTKVDLKKVLNAADYVGRAPEQVNDFINEVVKPAIRKYRSMIKKTVELKV
jgi:adenylosuccinate lyase